MKWEPIIVGRHNEADYANVHAPKYERTRDFFLEIAPVSVLDIGIGTGNFYAHLPDYTKYQIRGVDINTEFARVLHERGIETVVADVSKDPIPFPDQSFDLILCDSMMEHTLNPKLLIQEMNRMLKPGGHAIVVTPNATSAMRRWAHLRGRSIFEPLIDNLYSRTYLERCSLFYNLRDLKWVMRDYFTLKKVDFVDEKGHDTNALSVKLCRLLSMVNPSLRDVIITVFVKSAAQ